jgi:carbon monoxide dehydrogenase subunit G
MHFEGEFKVPGKASDVIRRFADVPRMSGCMPGAVLEPQAEDGSWPGAMVVTFGPKKVNFKGRATCEFDLNALTGSVHGRGTADMRAARIGVKVSFALRDDPAATTPTTIVKIVSDAELGGVLADFARAGGTAVANVIMADFARRAAEEFSKDEVPVEPATAEPAAETLPDPSTEPTMRMAAPPPLRPAPPPPRVPEPVPLAAHTLLWAVIKSQFVRLGRWLGLVR